VTSWDIESSAASSTSAATARTRRTGR
jgi:hypothetical protein